MIKITPLRNDILSIFKKHGTGLKAYDVIAILAITKPSTKANSVYRILNLLVKNNILHKIHSSNIFTLCNKHFEQDTPSKHIVLTCCKCLKVEEIEDSKMVEQLNNFYKKNNFNLNSNIYELSGHCNCCNLS